MSNAFIEELEELLDQHSHRNTPEALAAHYIDCCLSTYKASLKTREAFSAEGIELP